jgi:hypothetical protein
LFEYDEIESTQTTYLNNFKSASNLLGVLSLPKYPVNYQALRPDARYTSYNIYADVRALNGNMADLAADMDFAFKYRLTPELVPIQGLHPQHLASTNGPVLSMQTNLFELRLLFQWPLVIGGDNADYREQTRFSKKLTFRTLVSGQQLLREDEVTGQMLHFMNPRQYSYLTNTVTP